MVFHPGWHYSWLLSERIPFRPFLTLADCNEARPDSSGLQSGPARLGRTSASTQWGICLFLPADLYSRADASRPIPFDSPRRADSNETLPDSGGHLPPEISALFMLLTSIAMRTLRTLYHSIPLDRRIPTHPVPTLSDRWLKCYPNLCNWVPWARTFTLLATGCYRHADASRPIPFDSPRRADSNETLPDSGGHLPSDVSAFLILLTSTAMRTLWNLYHSIPLDRRIPTHPVPTMSDRWLKCYRNFCTWVPGASTFKLAATGYYRHADT